LFHVAEVGLTALVQRRRDTNNDGVRFLDACEIGGRAKVLGVDELLDLGLLDMLDVRLPGIEHVHFVRIGVESRDFVARFRETQGQRQSNVSAANDGDFQLSAFEEFGFPVYGHELRRSPNHFWQ
jgi:hypothetical protein